MAARLAASGRRAGHRCRVEMWPCRMFFSCSDAADASARGNAVSIRRLVMRVASILFGDGAQFAEAKGHAALAGAGEPAEWIVHAQKPGGGRRTVRSRRKANTGRANSRLSPTRCRSGTRRRSRRDP